jgi:hypothetical protein
MGLDQNTLWMDNFMVRIKILNCEKKITVKLALNSVFGSALVSVRIRIPHFVYAKPDPGFWWSKIEKNYIFIKKFQKAYPWDSIKEAHATGEVRIPKSTSKLEICHFCGTFLPSWVRIQPTKISSASCGSRSIFMHPHLPHQLTCPSLSISSLYVAGSYFSKPPKID